MDPIQVALGVLIGLAAVIAIQVTVVTIRRFSDRRQRSERDEAIEAAISLANRQLEEYVRSTKQSSSRPG